MNIIEFIKTNSKKHITLKKGEMLYSEGDECISIGVIEHGTIKANRSYIDGHENIIRILSDGDIIGLSLIFSSDPHYTASFYAMSDSKIYIVSKEELLSMIQTNREFGLEFLSKISDNSIELNHHIKLLSYKTIKERICYLLYMEYIKRNSLTFTLKPTKTALADFLNVERPSLSYELNKLIKEGIIANKGHSYTILNLSRLEEYI